MKIRMLRPLTGPNVGSNTSRAAAAASVPPRAFHESYQESQMSSLQSVQLPTHQT